MGRMTAEMNRIPYDDAIAMTVGEVMMAAPKTLPADAPVAAVRAAFANPSVRLVLLADGDALRGAIDRAALPAEGDPAEPASRYADPAPLTARPRMPVPEAFCLLERCREPRLAVLDDDGVTLVGVLCLHPASKSFCIK
jgi:CBS domain-containing protein